MLVPGNISLNQTRLMPGLTTKKAVILMVAFINVRQNVKEVYPMTSRLIARFAMKN